jgi:acetyltransferase-like isoleucine patch superfamily enzyme
MIKKFLAILCVFLPSAPTRFLYRVCGHRIGKNVKIPLFSYIYADEIFIGHDVDIRRFVYIHVHKISVGANTIISYGNQIKGPASFACQDNCFLGIQCVIHCVEDVTLGFYSGLGPRCTVYTHGSFLPVTMGYPAKFAPVIIEDFVWIAMEVTIMSGAHIDSNCIINPGVVIHSHIKSNSLIQMDPNQYLINDLSRLQKLKKKSVPYYHNQIISSFLNSRSLSYQYDAELSSYSVTGRFTFISHPDKNSLELLIHNKTKIEYDLEHFYTDDARPSMHRDFLAFIRFRYGIILRTRYRE